LLLKEYTIVYSFFIYKVNMKNKDISYIFME